MIYLIWYFAKRINYLTSNLTCALFYNNFDTKLNINSKLPFNHSMWKQDSIAFIWSKTSFIPIAKMNKK